MTDVSDILGSVGGIVGILSGGGVIQLWRMWRQEHREQHQDFWGTYEKSIATLRSQYERETDPGSKEKKKERLESVESEYHEQLEAYRQSSALRQAALRGPVSAQRKALSQSDVARLGELLDKAEPLSPALLTPDDYIARGDAYYAAKQFDKALEQYGRALELKPDDPITLSSRSATLGRLERHDEALADLDRVLKLTPEDPFPMYDRACYLALTGRLSESLAQLKEAISRDAKYRQTAREDEDFDNLRSDATLGPEFERLVAEPEG